MMKLIFVGVLTLALLGFASRVDKSNIERTAPNAKRLKTGRFRYRTLVNGKDAGNSEISLRVTDSGQFAFSNQVSGQFSQRWEAVATVAFVPISAKLTFGEGANGPTGFELRYQGGRVTGFATKRGSGGTGDRLQIDTEIPPDTVDQRIDWAAAMSEELTAGREFAFRVFDPYAGLSLVAGHVEGTEPVRVPAGTFTGVRVVYRIEKASGPETYQVLTNAEGPRMMLKEEFPNGAVTELVKAKE